MADTDRYRFVAAMATQYGKRLRRFLSVRLRNRVDAPDLAQEVFLRLLRVDDPGSIRSPEAYLFTVASHVVHQHTARQSAAPVEIDVADAFAEAYSRDDPLERVEVEERLEALQHVLEELPPRVAATLVLARLRGESLEEISIRLGVSRESVKKYLARALLHCRQRAAQSE